MSCDYDERLSVDDNDCRWNDADDCRCNDDGDDCRSKYTDVYLAECECLTHGVCV